MTYILSKLKMLEMYCVKGTISRLQIKKTALYIRNGANQVSSLKGLCRDQILKRLFKDGQIYRGTYGSILHFKNLKNSEATLKTVWKSEMCKFVKCLFETANKRIK